MSRRALITGVTGQDGSYLAELLLEKGYEVHGLVRRSSEGHVVGHRIAHLLPQMASTGSSMIGRLILHCGDMLDQGSINRILKKVMPDEVYNLAAMSFVPTSWEQPVLTAEVNALGALRLLEGIREICPAARVYQASSSEMFGSLNHPRGQGDEDSDYDRGFNEQSKLRPRSPYGFSKVYAHHAAINYRESYGMHVSCGIMFNHESSRRGPEFVTRKVCMAAARIRAGKQDMLELGDLSASRDWGWAPDYARAMWMILQRDGAADYVVATGEAHSVAQLCAIAFGRAGLDWERYVTSIESMLRPADIRCLVGDASRARADLGWEPSVTFRQMIVDMVDYEVSRLR